MIKEQTQGMTPNQFEAFAEQNDIFTEWIEVCPTDFNEGVYHSYLPDYDIAVSSLGGNPIQWEDR